MNTLYNKSCLRLLDFQKCEIEYIIHLSSFLKSLKKNNKEVRYLKNKNIVLIFEKESTRTRCAFEVAAFDQGANVTYLGPGNTHLGYKESIKDTARVLSRMYNGIQYRGHNHKTIEILEKYATVPVWNGLTEKFHPTQVLADLLTMKETLLSQSLSQISCAYIGDTKNNIGYTWLEAAARLGLNLRLVSPSEFWPESNFFLQCKLEAQKNNGDIICTENIEEGVKNVNFIYSDVWMSMGEPNKKWNNRILLLKKYQINSKMLHLTKNKEVKILHCLPAFHDNNTIVGKEIIKKNNLKDGIEITDEIFELHANTIFEQSENRLHTIKALMIASLTKNFSY
ncbi:MAG: ornithine carbamoyltransferase [Buchnera aphidicola (Meitanaphis flavogallis)]